MNAIPEQHTPTATPRRHSSAPWLIAAILSTAMFGGSGCASHVPVKLADTYPSVSGLPEKKIQVALVVKDLRADNTKKFRICGTVRSGVQPVTVAFLAEPEPLDVVVAATIKRALTQAGYAVASSDPPGEVNPSAKPLRQPPRGRGNELQKAMFANAQQAQPLGPAGVIADNFRTHRLTFAPPPADAVPTIEVTIRNLNSDCLYGRIQAWCTVDILGFYVSGTHKMKYWGKTLTSRSLPLTQYPPAVNDAYWSVVHRLEEYFRSDEFTRAVQEVVRLRGSKS